LRVVHRVVSHNPAACGPIARREKCRCHATSAEGLLLSSSEPNGMRRLCDGRLTSNSDRERGPPHPKSRRYTFWPLMPDEFWLWVLLLAMEKMNTPLFGTSISLTTRGATAEGLQTIQRTFSRQGQLSKTRSDRISCSSKTKTGHLFPRLDNYRVAQVAKLLGTVARSLNDGMRIRSQRRPIWRSKECPDEEDSTQRFSPHGIGLVGNEPAAFCASLFRRFLRWNGSRSPRVSADAGGPQDCAPVIAALAPKAIANLRPSQTRLPQLSGAVSVFGPSRRQGVLFPTSTNARFPLDRRPTRKRSASASIPTAYSARRRCMCPGILERSAIRPVTRPSSMANERHAHESVIYSARLCGSPSVLQTWCGRPAT